MKTLEERFWSKVDKRGPSECWEWQAARCPRGYGRIGLGGRSDGVAISSRVAWMLSNGPIPDGLYVCHHCDNPPCCNPAHLYAGTPANNAQDCARRGRHARVTRPDRTARGSRNGFSLLTESQVAEIRLRLAAGERVAPLSREFSVSYSTVSLIKHGKSWCHV